jgi:hypothetical protein
MWTCHVAHPSTRPIPFGGNSQPVGSKNSCSLAVVVLEQPTEPFPALDGVVTLAALAGRRKEPDMTFSLMMPLVMIMGAIRREGVP